jgi:hypothetical protein
MGGRETQSVTDKTKKTEVGQNDILTEWKSVRMTF